MCISFYLMGLIIASFVYLPEFDCFVTRYAYGANNQYLIWKSAIQLKFSVIYRSNNNLPKYSFKNCYRVNRWLFASCDELAITSLKQPTTNHSIVESKNNSLKRSMHNGYTLKNSLEWKTMKVYDSNGNLSKVLAPYCLLETGANYNTSKINLYLLKWWENAVKWDLISDKMFYDMNITLPLRSAQTVATRNINTTSLISNDIGILPVVVNSENLNYSHYNLDETQLNLFRNISLRYSPRLLCIGDVHGCLSELQNLLRTAKFRPSDQLFFLGDLVAKGPKSVEVVSVAECFDALAVRGNHEDNVINAYLRIQNNISKISSWKNIKQMKTGNPYAIANRLCNKHFDWLNKLPLFIDSPDLNCLFVHAGFNCSVKLDQQKPNTMMRTNSKWYKYWNGSIVYYGHSPYNAAKRHRNTVGLDSGCVYGKHLSMIILPQSKIMSVKAFKVYSV